MNAEQAEELAKSLAQMKQVLQGTHGMLCRLVVFLLVNSSQSIF